MKRFADILASALLLVAAAPVLAAAAIAVRIASPGPAIFRQQRVGRDGRPFAILKFRSMHLNRPDATKSSTTIVNDPRVFPVGRLLRKWKIDELPQLVNVLTGDMSLVGPRPTVQEDCDRMTPRQRGRSNARPGITGLSQVNGGAALPWPQRIELDLEYIERQSLLLDCHILLKTATLLLSGKADQTPTHHDEWSEAA